MPLFTITDPDSGRTLKLEGESAPTEDELDQIFSQLPPIPEQPAPQQPGMVDQAIAGGEEALTMLSALPAEIVSGLGGIARLLRTGDPEQASQITEWLQSQLQYQPRTELAQQRMQQVGEAVQPIAEPITEFKQRAGQQALELTGSPLAAAAVETIPTAVGEMFGLGAAKGALNLPGKFAHLSPTKNKISEIVERADPPEGAPPGTGLVPEQPGAQPPGTDLVPTQQAETGLPDTPTIKPTPDGDPIRLGGPTASQKYKRKAADFETKVNDPFTDKAAMRGLEKRAEQAIKMGFDEGMVNDLKMASNTDKALMRKMMEIYKKGRQSKRYQTFNRPSDVAGNQMMERVSHVLNVNQSAAKRLDGEAKKLIGQEVDYLQPVDSFIDNMSDMGIKFELDDGGKLQLDFMDSDIEGLTTIEDTLQRMVNRMVNTKAPDAYDVHRLKRFIDEQVSYGKRAEGLSGKSEAVLKKLRRHLDGILDEAFPEYDRVNTEYKDTRQALDAVKEAMSGAASKIDFNSPNIEKRLGTELRKLMSNYNSRMPLLESIDTIQGVAEKYGGTFRDDLFLQTAFFDELNGRFGQAARTSAQAEVGKGVSEAMKQPTSIPGRVIDKIIDKGVQRIWGEPEERAYQAMMELLKGVE